MSAGYGKDDRYVPFSNGTEHMWWLESNCGRGERGCRKYRPEATSSRDGCPIEVAIALAGCLGDGIPVRIAVRGGFLVPGANGRLFKPESETHPGAKVIPACPEYKGYDEPPDPPVHPRKPPVGQMDLLDPRHEPVRSTVAR